MATACYRCGRPLSATEWRFRHKLKTGESISRFYSPQKAHKIYTRYDMHIVCRSCHDWLMAEERRKRLFVWLGAGATALFAIWAVAILFSLSS